MVQPSDIYNFQLKNSNNGHTRAPVCMSNIDVVAFFS